MDDFLTFCFFLAVAAIIVSVIKFGFLLTFFGCLAIYVLISFVGGL